MDEIIGRAVEEIIGRPSFLDAAGSVSPGTRVPVVARVRDTDPFEAYRSARNDDLGSLLETTGGQPGWGYFGVDPVDVLQVYPDDVGECTTSAEDGSLATLDEWLEDESLERGECSLPHPCGAIGWISYDVARETESLPDTTEDARQLPLLQFCFYDTLVSWREPRDGEPTDLYVASCPVVTGDPEAAYERGKQSIESMVDAIRTGDPDDTQPDEELAEEYEVESNVDLQEYETRVETVQERITAGDTFQANISQRLSTDIPLSPLTVYEAVRARNPAPYSAFLEFPDVDLVSVSPELLVERDSDGRLVTEPIAGTRPRGESDARDQQYLEDLLTSEKESAEHAMLVDLMRNDLGKVCEFGSVEVSEYRRVDKYSEVMHLVSRVEGDERDDASRADVIEAVFPGGTITGAPKPKTMEIIDEVETHRRGPYTGAIAILGLDGTDTLSMTIRTMVRHAGRYYLRVGGGVVHDSDPVEEYAETLDKGRAFLRALDSATGERTSLVMENDISGRDL